MLTRSHHWPSQYFHTPVFSFKGWSIITDDHIPMTRTYHELLIRQKFFLMTPTLSLPRHQHKNSTAHTDSHIDESHEKDEKPNLSVRFCFCSCQFRWLKTCPLCQKSIPVPILTIWQLHFFFILRVFRLWWRQIFENRQLVSETMFLSSSCQGKSKELVPSDVTRSHHRRILNSIG